MLYHQFTLRFPGAATRMADLALHFAWFRAWTLSEEGRLRHREMNGESQQQCFPKAGICRMSVPADVDVRD